MRCLVLLLSAPMQSWGTQSRFTERDTGREPSKSGVVGLLCAALGRDREEPVEDLAQLEMGVRVDREGVFSHDYHTAGGGTLNGKRYGVIRADGAKGGTVVSHRYYLADAEFHVALGGEEGLLKRLDSALANPVWPLSLGRKSFPPSPPLSLGLGEGSPEAVLSMLPWRKRQSREKIPVKLRLGLPCGPGEGAARMDVPLSFANGRRRFTVRYVRTEYCSGFPVAETIEEVLECISHG